MIASEEQFDGRFVAASEVPATLASALFGIVVSYIPGQLVVYKDEASSDSIWLRTYGKALAEYLQEKLTEIGYSVAVLLL